MFPSLSTLGNIVAETFENCCVSSNVSQFVHPGKHCWGNIWELLCFLECFPVCPPWETLLRKHLRIAVFPRMFPSLSTLETLLRKHLRIAMFPRTFPSLSTLGNIVAETFENCYICFLECFPVCPPWETLLRKHLRIAMFPRMFPSLSTLGNIVAETFENCYVSSNVSQFVHPGKHCCGNIWELLCFLERFPVCPPWGTLLRKHLRIAIYVSSNVSQFVHPGKHCCGNIWELLCFFECFPLQFVHPREHCCGNIWELLCFLECFLVCPSWETLLRKHLRIAMFPRMFPSLSTLGNIVAETFENFYVSSNVSQFVHPGNIVAETFENCCVSSNVSQFVHPGKHCCGNIWELLCFLECFPVCPPWETLLNKLDSEDDYR